MFDNCANGNGNGNTESKPNGLLSTLLGPGGECFGYEVRVVGHSLGGAIAALLGIRVWHFSFRRDI